MWQTTEMVCDYGQNIGTMKSLHKAETFSFADLNVVSSNIYKGFVPSSQ